MSSPRQVNFGKFSGICQSQITGKEWMTQWPGDVDLKEAAKLLRPLALEFSGQESMTDDEVLGRFFSDQALAHLTCLRNMYCFWVIVQEAAMHIACDQLTIGLPQVLTAMENKPDIPKSVIA